MQWVNEELELSYKVLHFESDFANGYLFGEVLNRFNQQQNFSSFLNKSTADAKINNFCLLEPTIRALNIAFDSQTAYAIMQQQKGAAGKLLYQIKISIDKLAKTAPVSSRPTKEGGVKPLCNMPVRSMKPEYDERAHSGFEKSVRTLVDSQNGVMMQRTMKKFEDERLVQQMTAMEQQHMEEALLKQRKDELRQHRLHQTKREHDFLQDWQAKGAEDWALNQRIARERESVRARCEQKLLADKYNTEVRALDAQQSDMETGIAEFEKRLKSMGQSNQSQTAKSRTEVPGDDGEVDFMQRLEKRQQDKSLAEKEASAYLSSVKQRQAETLKLQKARQRRRRRFIADTRSQMAEAENSRLLVDWKNELLKESVVEMALATDLWKIRQYKSIMSENRQYREQQYAERRATDHQEAVARDLSALDAAVELHHEEVNVQNIRYADVHTARSAAEHERVKVLCSDVLSSALDLAMMVCHHREVTDTYGEEFALIEWIEMKRLFVTGFPAEQPRADAVLDDCELDDYLVEDVANDGLWCPDTIARAVQSAEVVEKRLGAAVQAEGVATQGGKKGGKGGAAGRSPSPTQSTANGAEDEGSVSATPEPAARFMVNYSVGDLIQEIRIRANPLPPAPAPPDVPQCKLCICTYGKEFSKKPEMARELASRYSLEVIEVDALLQGALSLAGMSGVAQEQADTSLEPLTPLLQAKRELGKEAMAILSSGKACPDVIYARLVANAICAIPKPSAPPANGDEAEASDATDEKAVNGWILADFPENVSQAKLLEKELTGFDETVHLPSPSDRASYIMPATPPTPRDPNIKLPSGISIGLWFHNSTEELLHRALGRRVDPVSNKKYHLIHEPPPEDVVDGRASLESPGLKERLQAVEINETTPDAASMPMVDLSARLAVHDYHAPEMRAWLDQFGVVEDVDCAGKDDDALETLLVEKVDALLEAERLRATAAADSAATQRAEEEAKQQQEAEARAAAEASKEATATSLEEAKQKVAEAEEAEAAAPKGEEKAAATAVLEEAKIALEDAQEAADIAVSTLTQMDEDMAAALKAIQDAARPPPQIPVPFAEVLAAQWDTAEAQYVDGIRKMLSALRQRRRTATTYFEGITSSFASFIRRPDDKQKVVQEFQRSFNAEEQDMRFDDRVKDELHRRIDEVAASLWDITEGREQEALEELSAIKNDGWIQDQEEGIENCFLQMMQLEFDRATTCKLTVTEHAAALKRSLEGPPPPDPKAKEPAEETYACPAIPMDICKIYLGEAARASGEEAAAEGGKKAKGKKGGKESPTPGGVTGPYPRLSRALHKAKVAAGMVEEEESAGGGKGKKSKGKDKGGSSGARSKASTPVPGTEGEDDAPSPENEALRLTIATENSNLVARLERLVRVARAVLGNLKGAAHAVYAKLEGAVQRRVADEASSISAVVAVAREAVEAEVPMPFELRLSCVDAYRFPPLLSLPQDTDLLLDRGCRLIAEPAPRPPPVVEPVDDVKFSPDQLSLLQEELLKAAKAGGAGCRRTDGAMACHTLVATLLRLAQDEVTMPKRWQALNKANFVQLAQLLDPQQTGALDALDYVEMLKTNSAALLDKLVAV